MGSVNQPDIILFMATIGITLFLVGLGEIIFGGDKQVMITEQLLIPTGSFEFEPFGGFVSIEQKDLTAVIGAGLLVAGLLLFLNKSKMGRATACSATIIRQRCRSAYRCRPSGYWCGSSPV